MSTEEPVAFVAFLVELEQPFDPARKLGVPADELVRFALTASDYWADRALDWLSFGCPVAPVAEDLQRLVDARARPQPLRHRALRVLRSGK